MSEDIEHRAQSQPREVRQRRPWSPPRVILSQLRATHHQAGATPLDKVSFNADSATPEGSVGS